VFDVKGAGNGYDGLMDGLEVDIRDLERRRLRALVDADVDVANRLHADDYELVTPGADRLSKADYLGAIASGEIDYRVFEPASDIDVLVLGETAVALRYVARIDIDFGTGTDLALALHTDIWSHRDGVWQAVWSQATRIRGG
jgi:hypothetical protein